MVRFARSYADPMGSPDDAAIAALLLRIRAGERVPVSEDLVLFPDTRVERSELRSCGDGTFEHVTFFTEFAPGHGWSLEQRQVEPLDEAAARALLRRAAP